MAGDRNDNREQIDYVSVLPSPNGSSGYTCPQCGAWVNFGWLHSCNGAVKNEAQWQQWSLDWLILAELKKISALLEGLQRTQSGALRVAEEETKQWQQNRESFQRALSSLNS